MSTSPASRTWDLCAATVSSLCVLHCIGVPIVAIVLPLSSVLTDNHALHVVLVFAAVPMTLWVVRSVIVNEGSRMFSALALLGVLLLVVAVSVPPLRPFEDAITLTGGLLLVGAHAWRWFHHNEEACEDAEGSQ